MKGGYMKLIKTYFSEQASKARAEIHHNEDDLYEIHYYNGLGQLFKSERFDDEQTAKNIAETWVSQIQVLKE